MNELITMDGEYVTRDGREVRVLSVELNHPVYPVAAITKGESGHDLLRQYTADGRYWECGENDHDLIPKPKRHKRTVWVNVYPSKEPFSVVHYTRASADVCGVDRIACLELHLDFAEGEGLEP